MPSSTAVRKRTSAGAAPRKKRAKSGRGSWVRFWPLIVCVAVTPFAVRAASLLALAGPKAFALLYPWVEVVRSPALHLPPAWLDPLAQWIIYLQFLVYGALMTVTYRTDKHLRAFVIGLCAHFGALLAVVVLAWLA